jgi:hypothetical protein
MTSRALRGPATAYDARYAWPFFNHTRLLRYRAFTYLCVARR